MGKGRKCPFFSFLLFLAGFCYNSLLFFSFALTQKKQKVKTGNITPISRQQP